MGLAPNPQSLSGIAAERAKREGDTGVVRRSFHADTSPSHTKLLRRMIHQRMWASLTRLLDIAEAGTIDEYHWQIVRRQMLTEGNSASEDVMKILAEVLGIDAADLPAVTERKGKTDGL